MEHILFYYSVTLLAIEALRIHLMIWREPADHGVQDASPSNLFLSMAAHDNVVGIANSLQQHQCGGN